MTVHRRRSPPRGQWRTPEARESLASVFVDRSAKSEAVRTAVAHLPTPLGVTNISVDSMSETFGCRIAVDLTGPFDEKIEGPSIARNYAVRLTAELGVPAFALFDLLRRNDSAEFH